MYISNFRTLYIGNLSVPIDFIAKPFIARPIRKALSLLDLDLITLLIDHPRLSPKSAIGVLSILGQSILTDLHNV